jgi:hypothetical protein
MALVAWLDRLLRQAGRPDLVQWDVVGPSMPCWGW